MGAIYRDAHKVPKVLEKLDEMDFLNMKKIILTLISATSLIMSAINLQAQNTDAEIRNLLHLDGFNQVPQPLINSARAAFPPNASSNAIVGYMEIPTFRLQYQAALAEDKNVADVSYSKEEQQGDYTKRITVHRQENVDLENGFPGLKALRALVERWIAAAHETAKPELIAEADSKLSTVQMAYYQAGLQW